MYIFRVIWWRFLFTHVTYFIVFQWNYTISSTTSNDVINVKPNWGCCFWILIIYLLVRKIDTRTFVTAPQYTFPLWKCIIRLKICAHINLFHTRCFGINMTSMWNHCIFICFIYVMCFFTRTSDLIILDLIFSFLKYLSQQDINYECIILSEMQHSQPQMNLYCAGFFKIDMATVNVM